MKIVLRAALRRFELQPVASEGEPTARRSITFSPARGATVILTARQPAQAPRAAALATA
jgi:cytochrome P450